VSLIVGVSANLLTTYVPRWWAQTSEIRKKRRIAKLRAELQKLTDEAPPSESKPVQEADTQRGLKLPTLRCAYAGMANCIPLSPHYAQYILLVENTESRYESTVLNLRGEILFRHFHGEEVLIKPATFVVRGTDEHRVDRTWFKDCISLGMKKSAYVLLFTTVFDKRFFAFDYDENNPATNKQLAFGEWTVIAKMEAENAYAEVRMKVALDPNGTINHNPLP